MKSHFFAGLAVENCLMRPGFRLLCVREVQKTLKESAKKLIESKIEAFGVGSNFVVQNDQIITPGGGVVSFLGMNDHSAESIKSLEGYHAAWVEEGQTFSARSLEILRPTIREEGSEIWCSWNPNSADDPVDKFFRGDTPPKDATVIKVSWRDNPWFPEVLEKERTYDEIFSRERYGHVWEGDYEPQAIGSLWNRAMLHSGRRHTYPEEMKQVVVALDPAISNEKGSDEHGIVVCGLDYQKKGHVLEDASLHGTPRQAAIRAVAMYDKWSANHIVYERNNGGKWIMDTLKSIRQGLSVKDVVATKGKYIRAEPVSSLYELGVIHHVGTFSVLEDQMCLMVSGDYAGKGSPDRVCAAVWGFTFLFPDMVQVKERAKRTRVIPRLKRFG